MACKQKNNIWQKYVVDYRCGEEWRGDGMFAV